MGLDVLSVRCHRHNISHAGGTLCPLCERERGERYAAEQRERELELERAAAVQRHGPMCGCPTCERPALHTSPLAAHCVCDLCKAAQAAAGEPQHVREARERAAAVAACLPPAVLENFGTLLQELHTLRAAKAGNLHRWPIPRTCIPPGATCSIWINVQEPCKLIRFELAADEGPRALERTRVGRISVGTRTIGEGGSLAQLDRCPLARLTMTPSVGAALSVENLSADVITLGGVPVSEALRDSSGLVRSHLGLRYADDAHDHREQARRDSLTALLELGPDDDDDDAGDGDYDDDDDG